MLCPKCKAPLQKSGCPECGWGKKDIDVVQEMDNEAEEPIWTQLRGVDKEVYEHLINALSVCTFQVGSYNKRFVRAMKAKVDECKNEEPLILSEKQIKLLNAYRVRYRRQIPTEFVG